MSRVILTYIYVLISGVALAQVENSALSFEAMQLDSISQSGVIDPIGQAADSLIFEPVETVADTVKSEAQQQSAIQSTITYQASDSIIVSLDGRKVFLYKSAQVNYEDIELVADYMEIDIENKEVYAEGVADSLGVVSGSPVFKQGSDTFESKTLRYNFESQKGIIENIKTEQGEGFVHGERAKKIDDDSFILQNGKYTTCNADHPHFYLKMTKAKAVSNKKFITGPAYMVLEDLPLYPIFLPFGFFPSSSTYSSGVIVPSYGEEMNRGFFLRGGGYYWAASDFYDLQTTFDIYSKGSWAAYASSRYRKKYKFSGSLNLSYNINKYGEKDLPDYYETTGFAIRWSHSQDSKANPSQTFSASVDLSTSSYDRENSYQVNNYLNSQKSSSISYSKNFENSPFNMSLNFRHSQNSRDSTVTISFPELTVNMTRIYPFRRKEEVGTLRFWEKIAVGYTGNIKNSITSKEDLLFEQNLIKDWKNGMQHSIPITLPSFNLFKHINIAPSFSYKERWYSNKQQIHYSVNPYTGVQELLEDTIYGFSRNYDYSMSLSASTNIFGMFMMTNPNWRVKAIRHKMSPSIGFSWRPDFGDERFGFYQRYTDIYGNEQYYNLYKNGVYGSAGRGRSGSINFSLNNLVEAKVATRADTTSVDDGKQKGYDKVSLLDNLSFSGSYNLIADSLNLSTISIRGRTTIKGVSINFGGTMDPYMTDNTGNRRINQFMWNNATGLDRLGRLTSANLAFGLSFKSKDKKGGKEGEGKGSGGVETYVPDVKDDPMANNFGGAMGGVDEFGNQIHYPGLNGVRYADFDMPWALNVNYNFNYSKPNPYNSSKINQGVNLTGNVSLTKNWKISASTNFDVQAREFSFTNININRSLHCWNMSFNFVPFGNRKSYSFTIAASSSMLRDLKVDKSKSWLDNR